MYNHILFINIYLKKYDGEYFLFLYVSRMVNDDLSYFPSDYLMRDSLT